MTSSKGSRINMLNNTLEPAPMPHCTWTFVCASVCALWVRDQLPGVLSAFRTLPVAIVTLQTTCDDTIQEIIWCCFYTENPSPHSYSPSFLYKMMSAVCSERRQTLGTVFLFNCVFTLLCSALFLFLQSSWSFKLAIFRREVSTT